MWGAGGISVKNGVNQEFSVSLSTDIRRCWGTIAAILNDISPTYGVQTSGVTTCPFLVTTLVAYYWYKTSTVSPQFNWETNHFPREMWQSGFLLSQVSIYLKLAEPTRFITVAYHFTHKLQGYVFLGF